MVTEKLVGWEIRSRHTGQGSALRVERQERAQRHVPLIALVCASGDGAPIRRQRVPRCLWAGHQRLADRASAGHEWCSSSTLFWVPQVES